MVFILFRKMKVHFGEKNILLVVLIIFQMFSILWKYALTLSLIQDTLLSTYYVSMCLKVI